LMKSSLHCSICSANRQDSCWECGDDFCGAHLSASTRRDPAWKVCKSCEASHLVEPLVYRANIKTRTSNQYEFALANRLFGFGWAAEDGFTGMDWDTYLAKASVSYADNPRWQHYMNLIHRDLAPGDFIWTRDSEANFYLGCITSRWHYVSELENVDADLVNVCDCNWQGPYTLDDVPGSLLQCRGPFRRVPDERVCEYSKLLYGEAKGEEYTSQMVLDAPNLLDGCRLILVKIWWPCIYNRSGAIR